VVQILQICAVSHQAAVVRKFPERVYGWQWLLRCVLYDEASERKDQRARLHEKSLGGLL
jgi:hypothetical protein